MDRENYLFGGYLVTQRVPRPEVMSVDLLPAQLRTASACIADFVPDTWLLDWTTVTDEQRRRAVAALGLDPATLPALTRHVSAGFDDGRYGWPNVVKSSEALAALIGMLPSSRDWVVLGLALHRSHLADFLDENSLGGVQDMLIKQASPPAGGVVLGFEPLGFEYGGWPHSWLCNHLEEECFRVLGIRPNPAGFLATEDEARRVVQYISRDEVGAEPVPWLEWMILDYSGEFPRGQGAPH